MKHEAYINRTYGKFDRALPRYTALMLRPLGQLTECLALQTAEHLRTPPAPADMTTIKAGDRWGCEYGNVWLHTVLTVPDAAAGEILCAIPDVQAAEILCFKNGKPTGIINSKNKFLGGDHCAMFISPAAVAGESITLDFECYAGHHCPGCNPAENYDNDNGNPADYVHTFHGIRFAILDREMRDFIFDLATVLQMARLPKDNFVAMQAHQALMAAFPYLIQDTREASEEELRESAALMRDILRPVLKKNGGDASRGYVGVIGHSHMDTAWLWTVDETIRKCARTYAQALSLMDMYPEYTFVQSSALHLSWMKDYYPDIFEGIRQRVADGRYEPNGGVWVECDCNITGGEAMVRQFLYGQRFTQQYLNYRSDCFWLPDTFGYNAAIPQIMQGCGVKYFYTTKIDWGDLTRFPTQSFVWRGLDGSEVISHLNRTHFIPDVSSLSSMTRELVDKHSCDMRLAAYGYGDGGGGPTFAMLEFLKRSRDLQGMPRVENTTVSAFMQKLEQQRDALPLYDGELYLELHRGTLTKMHEVKRGNRLSEMALHDMELLSVMAGDTDLSLRDELYRLLLCNQFHDILPGTCIAKVYERTLPEFCSVIRRAREKTQEYAARLSQPAEQTRSLINTLSFDRSCVATLDGSVGVQNALHQCYTDADGNPKTAVSVQLPAMGTAALQLTDAPTPSASAFVREGNVLITPFYRVVLDADGYISSLCDLAVDRELCRPGAAPLGTLWLGEDMPRDWDNWDIDDDVLPILRPVRAPRSIEVVSDGALEYRIRTVYSLTHRSTAVVDTVFYADRRRIDYEVRLDWQERHKLLKAGFDVAIRAATMKNEIQFGHIDRPTTRNTAEEAAKFEVCNHRWTDLSETHYGVAILNTGKYGISCEGSDLRLTLKVGGVRPDPVTDVGVQYMTYALLPHADGFDAESVIRPAYDFNYTPVEVNGALTLPTLFALDAPGIVCEAVKAAEDHPDAYVLRLYEAERNATVCTLRVPNATAVTETNMLEEPIAALPITNGTVKLRFRPFEIKTILIRR